MTEQPSRGTPSEASPTSPTSPTPTTNTPAASAISTATATPSAAAPRSNSNNPGNGSGNGNNGSSTDVIRTATPTPSTSAPPPAPVPRTSVSQQQQQQQHRHYQQQQRQGGSLIVVPWKPPSERMQSGSAYQSAPSYQQQQQPSQPQPQPQPTPQQAPPPPNFHPYYSLMPETSRERFYDILSGLDPYRSTPKEFIHLLVHAATRDREIADALIRLNHDRIHNPSTWRPTAPPNFAAQPLPPNQAPGSGRPVAPQPPPPPPPHQAFGQPLSGTPAAPSPAQEGTARPRKRKRKEANAGPKPNWRRTIMYMPPHQAPQTRVPPAQPQNLNHMQVNVAPTQQNPSAPVPVPEQQGVPSLATTFTPPNIERRYSESPTSDAYDAYEKAVKPIHGEPKERACNYTWTLDRAEVHLGFTGQYDGMTEQRQLSIGFEVALKLQKYLKRLNAALDNNVTVANRVHILTVMREILAATLEADNTLGKECRECSREYDSTYLAAVRKLTPEQLSRLKSLEHGKWLEEFQDLITVATRQNMFPLLKKAFDHINSAV